MLNALPNYLPIPMLCNLIPVLRNREFLLDLLVLWDTKLEEVFQF